MRGVLIVGALFALCLGPALVAEPSPELLLSAYRTEGTSFPPPDRRLSQWAYVRASALASSGELAHVDENGRSPAQQMMREGMGPGTYGEVLGAGANLDQVWAAWLASPTHRAVLDEPGWRAWGWGRAPRGQTWVWVLRFWKP